MNNFRINRDRRVLFAYLSASFPLSFLYLALSGKLLSFDEIE